MENATMTPERRKEIIDKVQACFARGDVSRGATQAEAETAIVMAKRLMHAHNLSMAEVAAPGSADETASVIEEDVNGRCDSQLKSYEKMLALVCQYLFEVKPLLHKKRNPATGEYNAFVKFIGSAHDVAMAVEGFKILSEDIVRMGRAIPGAAARSQYMRGVVDALLKRAKEAAASATAEELNACRAVVIRKDKNIAGYMAANYARTHTSRVGGGVRSEAYMRGAADGAGMALNFKKMVE